MAKITDAEKKKQRLVTPEFRLSFPHLVEPSGMGTAEPKFSITMLFPKTKDMSTIKLAIKHTKINFFGPDQKEMREQ